MIYNSILLSILLLSSISASEAAMLSSTVTRNKININETLQLTINIDQQVDSSALKIEALRENFDILGITPHSSSSVSINNGKTTKNSATQWTLVLAPKHVGVITIPAFTINNLNSQAIRITVTDKVSSTDAVDKPLDVKVSTSANKVYPEQQLILTIEISAQSNVSDLSGSQLELKNAEVELLSQNSFKRIDNGIARQFVELKYAVFAKQAGQIRIPSLLFTGLKNAQRSFFNTQGEKVIGRSREQFVTVKKKPHSDSKTSWFPAKNVSIHTEWPNGRSTLQAGTPITRNIIVTAQGQRANVIPPLSIMQTEPANFKSYKDQAQLDTQKNTDGLVATRIESEAIVPSSAGEITLPEVTLRWWNVKTQSWQTTVLAAETLIIAAGENTATKPQNTVQDKPVNNQALSHAQSNGINKSVVSNKLRIWQIIAVLLFFLCCMQSFLLLQRKKIISRKDTLHKKLDDSENQHWRRLQASIKQTDVLNIRQNTLNWARSALPNEHMITLHSLAERLDCFELKTAFTELEEHLYKDSKPIDTEKLQHALSKARQKIIEENNKKIIEQHGLKPLYTNEQ